jgi:peptidoglycan/LPS O-acetylase OafA/YrhL
MLKVLQAGRGVAAIGVAAFHLSIAMGLARYGGEPAFKTVTRYGALGVDFFFVLSGFIILLAHVGDIGKPHAWTGYLYRRFVRVYPIYWLYTAGFVALLAFGLGPNTKTPSNLGDWVTAFTLVRFTSGAPPFPVAWTLFHEVAFYAAFSLLILNKRVGVAVLAVAACVCLALYQYPDGLNRSALPVYTAAYNLFFLLGMGAYWLYKRGGSGIPELVAGASLVIAMVVVRLPHQFSKLALAAGLALTIAGLAKMESAGRVRVPLVLAFIGNASFTLYLLHESLEGLLLKVVMRTHLYSAFGAQVAYILVLAGTVALGCVVYAAVERPLLDALKRRWKKRQPGHAVARAVPGWD